MSNSTKYRTTKYGNHSTDRRKYEQVQARFTTSPNIDVRYYENIAS